MEAAHWLGDRAAAWHAAQHATGAQHAQHVQQHACPSAAHHPTRHLILCCRRGQAPNKTALVQICYVSSTPLLQKQQGQQQGDAPGSEGPALDVAALVASGGACCTCLLLHVWHTGVSDSLRRLLADERITKAGVNIGGDAAKLELDYGVQVKGGEGGVGGVMGNAGVLGWAWDRAHVAGCDVLWDCVREGGGVGDGLAAPYTTGTVEVPAGAGLGAVGRCHGGGCVGLLYTWHMTCSQGLPVLLTLMPLCPPYRWSPPRTWGSWPTGA
jgi:hypothetical protein